MLDSQSSKLCNTVCTSIKTVIKPTNLFWRVQLILYYVWQWTLRISCGYDYGKLRHIFKYLPKISLHTRLQCALIEQVLEYGVFIINKKIQLYNIKNKVGFLFNCVNEDERHDQLTEMKNLVWLIIFYNVFFERSIEISQI